MGMALIVAQAEVAALSGVDLVVLIVSVLVVLAFGMYMARKEEGTRDFFLAGRSVAWWAVAGSVFASNVSSHHIVGMTGAGMSQGFAQANFEFGAICGLMLLCYFFLPLYRKMGVYTLSEYLGRRYDGRSQTLYSLSSIVFMLIQMCGTLVLGALSVETLTAGTDYAVTYEQAVWGLALTAAVYTVFGGLKAVIYTDVVQSVLLLLGGGLIAVLAIGDPRVGGISGLLEKEPDRFHVFFPADHPQLPWTGVLTGLMILHFYYWGTNQFIVQRTLGARTGWDGRMGIILAGFLKLLIPFITIVPGMAAVYLLPIDVKESDTAFAALAKTLLPAGYGLVGIIMAGLVGAILSTIDSMMNSAATLFTFDFYRKYLNPEASERRLIWVGRVAMIVMGAAAIWLSLAFGETKEGIFNTMVGYNAYLVPGVLIAFLAGILIPAITRTAAVCAIVAGPFVSVALEVGADRLFDGHELQMFHRCGLAAAICFLILLIVSMITKSERDPEREQYVWSRFRHDATDEDATPRPLWQNDRIWASLLVAMTLWLCWFFA